MRFQHQVDERCVGSGSGSQRVDSGQYGSLILCRKVLPHNGMPHHGERAGGDGKSGDCLDGIAALQRRRNPPGDGDRAAQPIQPCGLIGPDLAQQRQFAIAARGIER